MHIKYPLISEELLLGVVSRYSNGPMISEAEITALPPDGLGTRPNASDVNAVAEYKVAEEGIRERYLIEQGKYLKD